MIINVFQKVESGCKPNKIWLDKGSESYNKSVKWWLKYSGIETYSKHSKEKSVD